MFRGKLYHFWRGHIPIFSLVQLKILPLDLDQPLRITTKVNQTDLNKGFLILYFIVILRSYGLLQFTNIQAIILLWV